jgi:hypothetical protein
LMPISATETLLGRKVVSAVTTLPCAVTPGLSDP